MYISILLLFFVSTFCLEKYIPIEGEDSISKVFVDNDGRYCWIYKQDGKNVLMNSEMPTDFQFMSFGVNSNFDVNLHIFMDESLPNDERKKAVVFISAQTDEVILLTPLQFENLDTKKIAHIPLFFDPSISGQLNTICFEQIQYAYNGPVINHPYGYTSSSQSTLFQNTKIEGDVKLTGNLYHNSVLNFIFPGYRFEVTGEVELTGAELKLSTGTWIFHQEHPHQKMIWLVDGSKLDFRDGTWYTYYPITVVLYDTESLIKFNNIDLIGGVTAVHDYGVEGSQILLTEVTGFGEIIVTHKNWVVGDHVHGLMIWLQFEAVMSQGFKYPTTPSENWNTLEVPGLAGYHYVVMSESDDVRYGMILREGAGVQVVDSGLYTEGEETFGIAVGIMFQNNAIVLGLANKNYYDDFLFQPRGPLTTPFLHVKNTRVDVWNVYSMGVAIVHISSSVIGEATAAGYSLMVLTDVHVDGTGGYVGAGEASTLVLRGCTIDSKLIASGHGNIRLEDTIVNGDAYVGDGTVTIRGDSVINGLQIRTGSGDFVTEERWGK